MVQVEKKTFREKAMDMVDKALPDLSELNKARLQTGMDAAAVAGHGLWMGAKAGATAMIGLATGSTAIANPIGTAVAVPMGVATWNMGKSTLKSFNDMIAAGKATGASFKEMLRLTNEAGGPTETPP